MTATSHRVSIYLVHVKICPRYGLLYFRLVAIFLALTVVYTLWLSLSGSDRILIVVIRVRSRLLTLVVALCPRRCSRGALDYCQQQLNCILHARFVATTFALRIESNHYIMVGDRVAEPIILQPTQRTKLGPSHTGRVGRCHCSPAELRSVVRY